MNTTQNKNDKPVKITVNTNCMWSRRIFTAIITPQPPSVNKNEISILEKSLRPLHDLKLSFLTALSGFFLLLPTINAVGQSNLAALKTKILKADSVLLTSHLGPSSLTRNNIDRDFHKMIVNGKINNTLIIDKKFINDSSIIELAAILTAPFQDSVVEQAMCFEPHHTIYIFSRNRISFIDICFWCREFETSKDIKFPEGDFDLLTWSKLGEFFKSQSFQFRFEYIEG